MNPNSTKSAKSTTRAGSDDRLRSSAFVAIVAVVAFGGLQVAGLVHGQGDDLSVERLPENWFTEVSDNALGVTAAERDSYYGILQFVRTVPADELRSAAHEFQEQRRSELPRYKDRPARDFPLFVDLFQHPDVYRGRPVTLAGYVRAFVQISNAETDPAGLNLYEGWIYTDDSETNPAVIITSEKPPGMPEGGELTEQVEVTGYFFKKYGYQAQDTTRLAPMVLASTLTWTPQDSGKPPGFPIWVYLLAIVLFGAAVYYVVRVSRNDEKRSRLRQRRESSPPPPDLEIPS